jgi:hypothetical protein
MMKPFMPGLKANQSLERHACIRYLANIREQSLITGRTPDIFMHGKRGAENICASYFIE